MNILPILLDIPDVKVIQTQVFDKEIHIIVESIITTTRCQHCGKQLTKPCGHDRERTFRHLLILKKLTFIDIPYDLRVLIAKVTRRRLSV